MPHSVSRALAPCPPPGRSRRASASGLAAVALWLAAAVGLPPLAVAAAGLGAALVLAQAALTLRARWRTPAAPADGRRQRHAAPLPFVSVHVPICNEPPALVCRTLSALAHMDGAFEVVVLDNNTAQRALWEPVRDHCLALGRRFRFAHRDRLAGAKAGALAECLRLADRRTTHVLTVDADYAVAPDLLEHAARAFAEHPGAGAVQFPQAYANVRGAEGLALVYRRFFDAVMPAAARDGAALLTGTLSVIRVDALEAAGGWSAATITEDADLGVRLTRAGRPVVYCPARVGHGLMPSELCALRAQRRRWACGNAQTLRQRGGAAAVWHQLTHWSSPLALPVAVLAAVAVAGVADPAHAWAARVAAASVAGWFALRAAVLAGGPEPAATVARAWLAERGLAWEALSAGWEGALGARLPFVRTAKGPGSGRVRGAGPTLAVAAVLAASGLALVVRGAPVSGAVSLASGALIALGLAELVRQLGAAERAAVPVHAQAAAAMSHPRRSLAS